MVEKLPEFRQQSLIVLLACYEDEGARVAAIVRPEHFSQPYQDIVQQLISYRTQYHRAPGEVHITDMFARAMQRDERTRRLIGGILELNGKVNAAYVADFASEHVRRETLKAAIMKAGEMYQQNQLTSQIEDLLYKALRSHQAKMDVGTYHSDVDRSLRFLEARTMDIPMGIREFDWKSIGAAYKQMLLLIAPKNTGKSWFCVHMGVQGLKKPVPERVLHISLEMDEEWVSQRYCQRMYNAALYDEEYVRPDLDFDDLDRLVGYKTKRFRPKIAIKSPEAREYFSRKLKAHGVRHGSNLLIKRFPTRGLTIDGLKRYLDYLDAVEHYNPTMIIIDYPDLMHIDPKNIRVETGTAYEDIRGVFVERHVAGICPTQSNRAGIDAQNVRATNSAEDIKKVFTADVVMTLSRTKFEKKMGLARLYLEYARNSESEIEVVITQAYAAGQFAVDSAFKSSLYSERMRKAEADERRNGRDEEDDEGGE